MKMRNSILIPSILSLSFVFGLNAFAQNHAAPPTPVGTDAGDIALVTSFIGDTNFTTNIFDLTTKAGLVAQPAIQPWSGTFWPLRSGSTANPYAAGSGSGVFNWLSFKMRQLWGPTAALNRFHRRIADIQDQISKGGLSADTIDKMAPSEKYDLFLGDANFSFTNAEWESMDEQNKYIGNIAFWEGSCHGWATAAIYEPRPSKVVNIPSLDGKYSIPFYPDDLKALATRLWANSLIQNEVVREGARCTEKDPNIDPRLGKVLDDACEGVNPADFHVTVLEMVGDRKQSFVVNRSNTQQVWNQPVAGYELTYFNPITDKEADLNEAVVPYVTYADPYVQFRVAGTVSIVGVEMKLHYISETTPSHAKTNDESNDNIKTLNLRYDLALDANNKIIGGEWRDSTDPNVDDSTNTDAEFDDQSASIPKFPGFLWKFNVQNPMAYSVKDADIPGNDITKVDRAALVAASNGAANFRLNWYNYDANGNATTIKRQELRPQPLSKVVNALITQSRQ
jgi:hypothetical protein